MALSGIFAYQPFKALYVFGSLFFNLSRLPFWILKFSLTRQHPEWSFKKAISLRITRAFIHTSSVVRAHTTLPLTPGKEGKQFVLIKPRAEDGEKFKGPMLANAQTVQPTQIGGTWYPQPLSAEDVTSTPDLLVILHIHGGAYVTGDGRTEFSGPMASHLLKGTPATHVLMPSYRLSRLPAGPKSNPFPAALQDALTSYLYLLHTLNIPASKIILSGDSAGANCVIALLRYLTEYGSELSLPNPVAGLLFSPWIDPTSASPSIITSNPHYTSDYLTPNFLAWGVAALAGQDLPLSHTSILASNPYVNHSLNAFTTKVPLWVGVGGVEVLYFDGKKWAEMMREEGGNSVEFDVQTESFHDPLLVSKLVGVEAEADAVSARVGKWLRKQL